MNEIPSDHPLRKLFRWATRSAFRFNRELHSDEVERYFSEWVLARFVHADNLYRIRNARGRRLGEVAEMLAAGSSGAKRPDRAERQEAAFHQHLGDYVLFMVGLFPEGILGRAEMPGTADGLAVKVGSLFQTWRSPIEFYTLQGQASYRKVYDLLGGSTAEGAALFQSLSERFGDYLNVMSLVRLNLESTSHFRELKGLVE
jgi:hypothetical protein